MKHNIENCGLLPYIIADTVCQEVNLFLKTDVAKQYVDYLDNRAKTHYQDSDYFRIQMNETKGRNLLYAFMRHWLSAKLKENHFELWQKLPASFSNGEKLPNGLK